VLETDNTLATAFPNFTTTEDISVLGNPFPVIATSTPPYTLPVVGLNESTTTGITSATTELPFLEYP